MQVIKKNGNVENVSTYKITEFLKKTLVGLDEIDIHDLMEEASNQLYDNIKTEDIDKVLILACKQKIQYEPQYSYAAARILLYSQYRKSFNKKNDKRSLNSDYRKNFCDGISILTNEGKLNRKLIEVYDIEKLSEELIPENDFKFKYLGLKTVLDRYCWRDKSDNIVELPQSFWMRVAMGLCFSEPDAQELCIKIYNLLSNFYFTPSTPTLFNSGKSLSQLSSCFLSTMDDDIDSIMGTIHGQALLSKHAGGLAMDMGLIRASGSRINSTGGKAAGPIRYMKIINDTILAFDQGGKRPGVCCCYLPTWHKDILSFIDVRKNTGDDRLRCHDLNTANWIPDEFMSRVENNDDWYLFCPTECPKLNETYGDEFNKVYAEYIKLAESGKIKNWSKIKAKDLWKEILKMLLSSGHPWINFKDPCNIRYANKHAGIVRNSNLCCMTADQRVSCDLGLVTVEELYKLQKEIKVVGRTSIQNGSKMVMPKRNSKIVKIVTLEGFEHKVTPDHKVWVKDYGWKEAKDLVNGDILLGQQIEGFFGDKDNSKQAEEDGNKLYRQYINEKHIPEYLWTSNKKTILTYLDKIFLYTKPYICCYASKTFLQDVQLLLANLGYITSIREFINPGVWSGYCLDQKPNNELYFSHLEELDNEDVYCLEVDSEEHSWTVNGIVTKNTEIIEHTIPTKYKDGEISELGETATCFPAGTKILTRNGQKNIEDCNNEEVLTYFKSDEDFSIDETFEKSILINQGTKDVFKITCEGGYSIEATKNHLFLIKNKNGTKRKDRVKDTPPSFEWIKLKDLKIGDKLFIPETKTITNNVVQNIEYQSAGWMLGDGWMTNSFGVVFGPKEKIAINKVCKQFNSWNSHALRKAKPYTQKNGVVCFSIENNLFKEKIKNKFGFSEATARFKKIPEQIFNTSKDNISSFLSGLFSADGSVVLSNNKLHISLSSVSEDVLRNTQKLLKIFGIHSRYNLHYLKTRNKTQGNLNICGKNSIKNFQKYIGFNLSPNKNKKLKKYVEKIQNKNNISSRDNTKIISIEYIGKKQVYDLSVSTKKHFIANGFIVHNCNLGSLGIPSFYDKDTDDINWDLLEETIPYVVRVLDLVITNGYYPTKEARKASDNYRYIGQGIMGIQDLLHLKKLPVKSPKALKLNDKLYEFISYHSIKASINLAKKLGKYPKFEGSDWSKGIMPIDTYRTLMKYRKQEVEVVEHLDWDLLRKEVVEHGIRNATLLAIAPTVSISSITGFNPSIEPIYSVLHTNTGLSGSNTMIDEYFVQEMKELGLWNKELVKEIQLNNGDVSKLDIPQNIKERFKTAFQINQHDLIALAAVRQKWIDQSQSLNLYYDGTSLKEVSDFYFDAWKKGIKTTYYLKTLGASNTEKVSTKKIEDEPKVCNLGEQCVSCQ